MKRKRPTPSSGLKQTTLLSFLCSPSVSSPALSSPRSSPDVIPCSPSPAQQTRGKNTSRLSTVTPKARKTIAFNSVTHEEEPSAKSRKIVDFSPSTNGDNTPGISAAKTRKIENKNSPGTNGKGMPGIVAANSRISSATNEEKPFAKSRKIVDLSSGTNGINAPRESDAKSRKIEDLSSTTKDMKTHGDSAAKKVKDFSPVKKRTPIKSKNVEFSSTMNDKNRSLKAAAKSPKTVNLTSAPMVNKSVESESLKTVDLSYSAKDKKVSEKKVVHTKTANPNDDLNNSSINPESKNINCTIPKSVPDSPKIFKNTEPKSHSPLKAIENVSGQDHKTPKENTKFDACDALALAAEFDSAFFDASPSLKTIEKSSVAESFDVVDAVALSAEFDSAFESVLAQESSLKDIEDAFFEDCDSLDLSKCMRCIVTGVQRAHLHTKLTLRPDDEAVDSSGSLILKDMWAFIEVGVGDVVGVQAVHTPSGWMINAKGGWLALHPATLISSTQLAGSMFCRRRGVLSSVFKGLDSDNKVMTVGSIVHELFQSAIVLPAETVTEKWLQERLNLMLATPDYLRLLYSSETTVEEVTGLVQPYIARIVEFVDKFMTSGNQKAPPASKNEFRGKIHRVVQIEENLASSLVGLNGRVDVTVEVELDGVKRCNVPLELKTGRASYSAEHRAQLAVYTVVMSLQGTPVTSGILVYLREGHVSLITPTHADVRDVMLLRNELVRHLRPWSADVLPDPIQFPNACVKCPYNQICSALLDDNTSENHPLRGVVEPLPPSDLAYLRKWLRVMTHEAQVQEDIEAPLVRLRLVPGAVVLGQQHKYTLEIPQDQTESAGPFTSRLMTLMCDVTGSSLTVRVVNMTSSTCSVLSEIPLPDTPIPTTYTLKKLGSGMLSRYLSGLAMLLPPDQEKLRNILVHCPPSTFNPSPSVLSPEISLNAEQQRALADVLRCNDYMLIEGPPGTGKTHTIVAIVCELVRHGQSVLLACHTHSSLDNILLKLRKTNVEFLRLGAPSSVHEDIRDRCYTELVKQVKTTHDVHALVSSPVVASTCLGLDGQVVGRRRFDVCIVDESSQVLQPEVVRALIHSDRHVLVGDARQLGPVVRSADASAAGAAVSTFDLLQGGRGHTAQLSQQYRMNRVIMGLANALNYGGRLRCGAVEVEVGTLPVFLGDGPEEQWLAECVNTELNNSIVVVDTGVVVSSDRCSNVVEVGLVRRIVRQLLLHGVTPYDVGVTAPYRKQISLLTEALPSSVEVKTVDMYQGRDKSCMIISFTRTNPQSEARNTGSGNELLDDSRRLNVAITRAKHKLIMVGDVATLRAYAPLRAMFEYLPATAFVSLG